MLEDTVLELELDLRSFDGQASSLPVPENLAAILYTSGSTGLPKGVMLSQHNLLLGAASVNQYLKISARDRLLAVLPFSFDYGLNQLISAFMAGASLVLMDYLLPRDVIRAIARYQVTGLAGIPSLWKQLAALDWDQQQPQRHSLYHQLGRRNACYYQRQPEREAAPCGHLPHVRSHRGVSLDLFATRAIREPPGFHRNRHSQCRAAPDQFRWQALRQAANRANWCMPAPWSPWVTGMPRIKPQSVTGPCRDQTSWRSGPATWCARMSRAITISWAAWMP